MLATASTPQRRSACTIDALIGVMTYAFARIGAVVAMKVEDIVLLNKLNRGMA
jgi:hypothetical protein